MTNEQKDQWILGILGSITIALLVFESMWGAVFGFISEYWWLRTTIRNKQWGLVFLCVVYTIFYAVGICRLIGWVW